MYRNIMLFGMSLYDFFGVFSTIVLVIFNLLHMKRKRLCLGAYSQSAVNYFSNKHPNTILSNTALWAVIETVLISSVQYLPPYNRVFGNLVGTGANYYGLMFISPVLLMLMCYLLAVNPLKQMDLITPAYPLALIFVKIACFCQGCCRGFEWSEGLYNHSVGLYEFPVQLVESGLALLLFIFLMFWRKKAKEGTLFPTYLILYSATRFFSEFLRCEPNVIWNLKIYQILCISGVIVGIIELIIALKLGDKIAKFYSEYHLSLEMLSRISYNSKVEYTILKKKLTKKENTIVHHKNRKKKKRK